MPTSKKFGFAQAAKRLGLTIVPYASIKGSIPERRSVYRISDGEKELFTLGATLLSTSFIGMKIAADKATTNEILRGRNIPTTDQILVENTAQLERFYTKHRGDILMKPLASTLGRGVHGALRSFEEATKAFYAIQQEFQYVLAEKTIQGKEYRVLVFEGHVIAIAEFVPPTLIGNGVDTILELIHRHNQLLRGESGATPIPIKPELVTLLADRGLMLSTIPEKDIPVILYRAAPISHGGRAIDVTEKLHPTNRKLFISAAKAIHLNIAGIDVITENISIPLADTGGVIIEINGGPDLSLHQHPTNHPDFDAAEEILQRYFNLQKKITA